MSSRPPIGPSGALTDVTARVASTEREGLWRIPWGHCGCVGESDDSLAIDLGTGTRTLAAKDFAAVEDRRYKVTVAATLNVPSGGRVTGAVQVGGVQVAQWVNESFSAGLTRHVGVVLWSPPEGFGVAVAAVAVTIACSSSHKVDAGFVLIEDIGGA
jgi:hypothetical protein